MRAVMASACPFPAGGDAVVAFKESCKPEPSGDGEGGLLIKAHKAAPGVDGSAACGSGSGCSTPSEALMSRRALVAAAALSGRTSSGLADAMADLPFGAAPAGDDLVSTSQQQQQQVELQQAEGSMRACPSAQSLSRQSSLAAPLLGRPRGSTSSVAGLDGAAGAPGEAPGPSNGNTGSSPEIV